MSNTIKIKTDNMKKLIIIFSSAFLLLIIAIISIKFGTLETSFQDVIKNLFGLNNKDNSATPMITQIISNIRIPRILTSIFAGMNLAVSGVLLQGILRNPMASPKIIGVNSGAGLAAIGIMVLFPLNMNYLSIGAFAGALTTALMIYGLSYLSGRKTVNLILAGVAISALFQSLTSGLMILNNDELNITYNWLIGSFSGKGWSDFNSILPYSIIGLISAFLISPKLNLLMLGEEIAGTMGISIQRDKLLIITISALLAGSAVSVSGTLGFVGIICPHIARVLIGVNHKYLIPLAAIMGGILLAIADTIARTAFAPYELPVGILISILGAPFFLYLLIRPKKNI